MRLAWLAIVASMALLTTGPVVGAEDASLPDGCPRSPGSIPFETQPISRADPEAMSSPAADWVVEVYYPHEDVALEGMLPDTLDGRSLLKGSTVGVEMSDDSVYATRLVKLVAARQDDYATAWADDPTGTVPSLAAIRIDGWTGEQLIEPYMSAFVEPSQFVAPVLSCRWGVIQDRDVLWIVRDGDHSFLPSEAVVLTRDALVIARGWTPEELSAHASELVEHLDRAGH